MVTLAFAGDMHFDLHLAALLDPPQGARGPVTRTLADADLTMVNLESAITDRGTPEAKELEEPGQRFHFRTAPGRARRPGRGGGRRGHDGQQPRRRLRSGSAQAHLAAIRNSAGPGPRNHRRGIGSLRVPIRLRFQHLGIPNLHGRTRALRELLLHAPPAVVVGMLGYTPGPAEAIAAEAGATWKHYAAGDRSRSRSSSCPVGLRLCPTQEIPGRTRVRRARVWVALPMRGSTPSSDAGPMASSTNSALPAEDRPGRSSTVSTDGTRIGWITKGRGEPLMLVHGGGADHTRLESFADSFSGRFAVHLVDRRGRGMSGDADTYDIELEYDDIAAVAEAIGQKVTLLGHSYGGPIAIGAATRTDAIARVIAYEGWPSLSGSPPSYEIGDAAERIQALLDSDDREGAVTLVFRDLVGLDEAQLAEMRTQPSWQARLAAAATLPRELRTEPTIQMAPSDLAAIAAPVLLVIGSQNESALRPGADQLCSHLRDARVHVLLGQGHMAFDTAPDLLATAITAFVEATTPSVGR